MLSRDELTRYSRNIFLSEVGRAGQERLRAARVFVIIIPVIARASATIFPDQVQDDRQDQKRKEDQPKHSPRSVFPSASPQMPKCKA